MSTMEREQLAQIAKAKALAKSVQKKVDEILKAPAEDKASLLVEAYDLATDAAIALRRARTVGDPWDRK